MKKAKKSKPKVTKKKPKKGKAARKTVRKAVSRIMSKKSAVKSSKKPAIPTSLELDKKKTPCVLCGGDAKFVCQSCGQKLCLDHFDVCLNVCYECRHEIRDVSTEF